MITNLEKKMNLKTLNLINIIKKESNGQFYKIIPDFEQDENWDGNTGNEEFPVIHLIKQNDHTCTYGAPVNNIEDADVFVIGAFKSELINQLDMAIYGDTTYDNWHDSYAQTHGWSIK